MRIKQIISRITFVLFPLLWIHSGSAQPVSKSYGHIEVVFIKQKHPKRIFAKLEITHAFPGGDSVWIRSVEENINRSVSFHNGARKGRYLVSVAFITDKDGILSDIRCVTDPGYGFCEAVMRVLKKTTPWVPAEDRRVRERDGQSQ